jgi:hypothetical protein
VVCHAANGANFEPGDFGIQADYSVQYFPCGFARQNHRPQASPAAGFADKALRKRNMISSQYTFPAERFFSFGLAGNLEFLFRRLKFNLLIYPEFKWDYRPTDVVRTV